MQTVSTTLSNQSSLNFFTLEKPIDQFGRECQSISVTQLDVPRGRVFKAGKLLTDAELSYITQAVNEHGWMPVSAGGSRHTEFMRGTKVGSYRASADSSWLAEVLWERLSPFFGGEHCFSDQSLVDWERVSCWKAIGLSSVMRFVKYKDGCEALLPHYDESIRFEDGSKSMVRVLIYLSSTGVSGGDTFFVKDPEIEKPYSSMVLAPHSRMPAEKDVVAEVSPVAGGALIFDHKVLHGSRYVTGPGEKLTLRTDILYIKSDRS